MKDESIITSDWSASPMAVYGKEVEAGVPLSFGGNQYGGNTGAKSNYFAVVKFEKPGRRLMEILSVSSNRSYRLGEAKRREKHYMDRKYRIKRISPELEGGVLVRTANNDKWNKAETHLRLYMYKPATLFVAYDRRGAANPPQWLAKWERTDLTVHTGDYRASPMVVYRRSFGGDEIAELGGNRFNGGQKSYSNYFVVGVPDEPWKRKALMVVGGSRLNFSDALVKSRLEARGFRVTLVDDDAVEATDGDGMALILISETVYSKRVGDIFAQTPVPIICWEPYLFDDLGMTGSSTGIDYGYVPEQRALDVIQPEHPMASENEKELLVTEYPARFGWAVPDESAEVVATLLGDPGKAAVFHYDAETTMPGGFSAPARRIGLFFDKQTPRKLNANGRRLLEAAFDTALGVNSLKILSGSSWKAMDEEVEGWSAPEFDDSDWRDAVAPYPNRKPADHWFRMPGTTAEYMWDFPYGGEMNGRNGPEEVWLRKDFNLPVAPAYLTSATVTMAVDDVYDFYVNGQLVASTWDDPGNNGLAALDISEYLVQGDNVLAIYASDAYRGYEWALFEATIEWEPVEIPEREWTIMVYLNGDNANEDFIQQDLQEIEQGLISALAADPQVLHKLAVVVQYDGRGSNNSARYLFREDDSAPGTVLAAVLPSPDEVNMGDPKTLGDFIADSQNTYPAAHFAVILANHGDTVASMPQPGFTSSPAKYALWDETSGYDALYVGEITHGPDGPSGSESVHVIGLDTGFMGTVETAYQFRADSDSFGADFMVASPGQALPEGWDYNAILSSLGDVAELTPEDLARTIVAKAYSKPAHRDHSLGAYDLTVVSDIKTALDQLALQMGIPQHKLSGDYAKSVRGYTANGGPRYYTGPSIIEYFDDSLITNYRNPAVYSAASNWLQTPLFDLQDFTEEMSKLSSYTPPPVVTAAMNLDTAVKTCVLTSMGKVTRAYFNGRYRDTEILLTDGDHGFPSIFRIDGNRSF